MANAAAEACAKVLAAHPEAVVVERGRYHIKHRLADGPDGRPRYVLDSWLPPIAGGAPGTINEQVGAGGDDGYTRYTPPSNNPGTPETFNNDGASLYAGCVSTGAGYSYNSFMRFTGISGLSGATIVTAYIELWAAGVDSGTPETLISADDQESPAAPTTKEEHDGATRTTAQVPWDNPDLSSSAWVSSPEIKTVIQELADSYDPGVIQILWDDDLKTDSDNRANAYSYDGYADVAPKLHIEYTSGAAAIASLRLLRGVGR